MSNMVSQLVAPHPVNDPARLAALVSAYKSDADVPPVVAIDFGSATIALCGSHRIEAAKHVYGDATAEEMGWIVLDGEALYDLGIPSVSDVLDRLCGDRVGDYSDAITALLPHLPTEAQAALADQV